MSETTSVEDLLDRAQSLRERGDRDGALAVYAEARSAFPDSSFAWLRAAELLMDTGDAEIAEPLLVQGVGLFPHDQWLGRAYYLCARRRDDKVLTLIRLMRARELFPDFSVVRADFVHFVLHAMHETEAAEALAGAAVRDFPDQPYLYDVYAQCAEVSGDHTAAADRWAVLCRSDRGHDGSWASLVRSLQRAGRYDDADAMAEEGLQHVPDGRQIRLAALANAEARGEPRHIEQWLSEIASKAGIELDVGLRIAQLRERIGDPGGARAMLDTLIGSFPDRVEPMAAAIRLMEGQGDGATAERYRVRLRERFAEAPIEPTSQPGAPGLEAMIALAREAAERGDWDAAQCDYARVRDVAPQNPIGWTEAGRAMLRAGDAAGADALFTEATTRLPEDLGVWRGWAETADAGTDQEAMAQRWRTVLERFPALGDAYIRLRQIYYHLGRFDDMEAIIRTAMSHVAEPAEMVTELIDVLLAMGKNDQALEAVRAMPADRRYQHWRFLSQVGRLMPHVSGPDYDWLIGLGLAQPSYETRLWQPFLGEYLTTQSRFVPAEFVRCGNALKPLVDALDDAQRAGDVPMAVRMLLWPQEIEPAALDAKLIDWIRRGLLGTLNLVSYEAYGPALKLGVRPQLMQLAERLAREADLATFEPLALLSLTSLLYRADFRQFDALVRRVTHLPDDAARDWRGAAIIRENFPRVAEDEPARIARAAAVVGGLDRKLKVAILVTGQLRGYRKAWTSWHKLNRDDVDITYFVHSWNVVGRKLAMTDAPGSPAPNFGRAYLEAVRTWDAHTLIQWYPSLSRAGSEETVESLQAMYGTPYVVLQDDRQAPFNQYTPHVKQYFKLQSGFEMIAQNNLDFDVIVRLRPDKWLDDTTAFDWREVYRRSIAERAIFCDDPKYAHGGEAMFMGDQFAVGAADLMAVYCRSYDAQLQAMQRGTPIFPTAHRHHISYGATMFYGAIDVQKVQGLRLGGLMDADPLSPEELRSLLDTDTGGTQRSPLDEQFYQAVTLDLAR